VGWTGTTVFTLKPAQTSREGLNKSPRRLRYTAYCLPNPRKPAVFCPLTQGAIAAPDLFRGSLVLGMVKTKGIRMRGKQPLHDLLLTLDNRIEELARRTHMPERREASFQKGLQAG